MGLSYGISGSQGRKTVKCAQSIRSVLCSRELCEMARAMAAPAVGRLVEGESGRAQETGTRSGRACRGMN